MVLRIGRFSYPDLTIYCGIEFLHLKTLKPHPKAKVPSMKLEGMASKSMNDMKIQIVGRMIAIYRASGVVTEVPQNETIEVIDWRTGDLHVVSQFTPS